jgi:hypothetical protein
MDLLWTMAFSCYKTVIAQPKIIAGQALTTIYQILQSVN